MSDLLPCPFCGGEAYLTETDGYPRGECTNEECRAELCGSDGEGKYEAMEAAVVKWNTRTSQWVSVKDRMPEGDPHDPFVLAYDAKRNLQLVLYFSVSDDLFCKDGTHYKNITHWQPLPNPPETP